MQDSRASGQTGAMDAADEFVLVPRAPTEEMKSAGMSAFMAAHDLMFIKNEPTGPIYKAMIGAAPRALRAVLPALSPPAIGDGEMRNAIIEECAQAAILDSFGAMGNDCCLETRDRMEQATVDAIRALKTRALHTDEKKGG